MASSMFSSSSKPHFMKPIYPSLNSSYISIPDAFYSKYVKGKHMGNEAKLRSDASKVTWNIQINGKRLTKGWKEFAQAHNLQVGDILLFRHEGNLLFHVKLFRPSCCEISYARKDENHINDKTRKLSKNEFPSDYDTNYVVPVTASNQQTDTVRLRRGFTTSSGLSKQSSEIILVDEKGRSSVLDLRYYEVSNRFAICKGWRDFCNRNEYKTGCFLRLEFVGNEETPVFRIIPLKRDEDNIGNHLEKIEEVEHESVKADKNVEKLSLSDNFSFAVSVTVSNLGQDKLNLPVRLSRENLMDERFGKISLIDKTGKTWISNLNRSNYDGRFYITKGWRSFCEANGQKAGSTILFKLVTSRTEAPVLLMISETSEKTTLTCKRQRT